MLTREDVLQILRFNKERFAEKYGVTKLGLFGSFARNEATEESDVDVCVEMPPIYDNMFDLWEEIVEKTSLSVDLVRVRRGMDSLLKKRIKKDAIYV
jgi:predicted nucleotidyltransferase